MRWAEGGTFATGSANFHPEEAPMRRVRVDGFWVDETPVTNREFGHFVEATPPQDDRGDRARPQGLSRHADRTGAAGITAVPAHGGPVDL
jgi:formylglycine-generating enzyme